MLLFLAILLKVSLFCHAGESLTDNNEKPHQRSCILEFKACSKLKGIDLDRITLAKKNKNPTTKDKEDLLVLTRCLFKEEVPTSEICKAGLKQTVSSMTWFQKRIFNNLVL